jgi:LytR cell envelope-related transcriptional attenuator
VDAPLPAPPDSLVRPWKTATIVASLVAAVELVLLLAAALLLLAKPLSHAMQRQAEAAAAPPAAKHTKTVTVKTMRVHVPVAKLPRSKVGVIVLNGNGQNGAAGNAAARLESLHYRVRSTGNASRQNYATSVVMYRRGYEGEGARLARDLHVKVVGPLDGLSTSALHGGQLALVVGAGAG